MMNLNANETTSINIERRKIKNLYLHVRSPDVIHISAPMRMSLADIHAFIDSKAKWIKKQQAKLVRQAQEPVLEKTYCDEELHYVYGKPYRLKVVAHTLKPIVYLTDEYLHLYVHPTADVRKKQAILELWYSEQLKIKTSELVRVWQVKMNVSVKQIKIRKMKTRWGSCSPHAQSIRINFGLVKKSVECLEYIVIHELTHLLEPSHNKRFVRLMDTFLPDWRERRKTLNNCRLLS